MATGGISPQGDREAPRPAIPWALSAVLGFAVLSWFLARPPRAAGIHDSDSALFVVESLSLSQTSLLDARPEWNSLMRIAAMPWGGLHIALLRPGLIWARQPADGCRFQAGDLYRYWSLVGAAGVVLAGLLGYHLGGVWGAVWSSGLVSAGIQHVGMYTQFNQVGTAALGSGLLLLAGAWRAGSPGRRSPVLALGFAGFLYPFADNLAPIMWLAFPVYLWLRLPQATLRSFVRAIAPFVSGTAAAVVVMAGLIGLRYRTGATVFNCPLLHLASRALRVLSHPAATGSAPASPMSPGDLLASFGIGGLGVVLMAAMYGAARVRDRKDVCLVPVALAYSLPLLMVPRNVTMVTEYFRHAANLLILASAILLARAWSPAERVSRWSVPTRVMTVACLILMLVSAGSAGAAARRAMEGEAWSALGERLARLPADAVIASTAEKEVGILYAGRRILTRNDTEPAELARDFAGWPGRIDTLIIRTTERPLFADLIVRRRLEFLEEAASGSDDRWSVFGAAVRRVPPAGEPPGAAPGGCRRQPYIPYSFDAGWRYPPQSILGVWGTSGFLLAEPRLWVEWSRATRLPYESFAGLADASPSRIGATGGWRP